MKTFLIFVVLFMSECVQADCQDTWLGHHSATMDLRVEYGDACYSGNLEIQITTKSLAGKHLGRRTVPFDRECTKESALKEGHPVEFSCAKDGQTPLAGGTFRYMKVKQRYECQSERGTYFQEVYRCVKGCSQLVPRELVVHPDREGPCA